LSLTDLSLILDALAELRNGRKPRKVIKALYNAIMTDWNRPVLDVWRDNDEKTPDYEIMGTPPDESEPLILLSHDLAS
jgi:hypothetical protein